MTQIRWHWVLFALCFLGLVSCKPHRTPRKISFVNSSSFHQSQRRLSASLNGSNASHAKTLSLLKIVSGAPFGNKILEHTGFVVSYNINMGTPSWVAWELTSEETNGPISRKGFNLMPDPQLEVRHQVEKNEYANCDYDRGHMCPAGDMKWSTSAMNDCHYMTNICPQSQKLNQVYWERLESAQWKNTGGR